MKRICFFLCLYFTLSLHAEIDWPHIIEDITAAPETCEITPVVGGASNVNYRLLHSGVQYFVRFAPKTIESLYADLGIEYEVLDKMQALDVSAKPFYYDPSQRVLVTDYITQDSDKIDLLDSVTRRNVFELLHRIEDSGIKIPRTFRPYHDVMNIVQTAKDLRCDTFEEAFYNELLPALKLIDAALAKYPKKTLCHLDLHSKNIVKGNDRYWIVDWEYAAMSHPFLVLASMASIERWDDQEMHTLLSDYMTAPTADDYTCLYLYRIVTDILWTAWNHVQEHYSPIDNPYAAWEQLFYESALARVRSAEFQNILNNQLEVILVFGPPGAGKGTFSQYAKGKGYGHISAGDVIRDEIVKKTPIGLEIEEIVKRGEYIDPVLMFQLIKNRAEEFIQNAQAFIIDGYGRTTSDAARLRQFLHEIKAVGRVVFLDAPDATCRERIVHRLICPSCNEIYNCSMGLNESSVCPFCHETCLQKRLNDTPEVTDKRLKQYRELVYPCYQSFLVDLPYVLYNTDRDLKSCLCYYDSLLDPVGKRLCFR